MLGVDRSSVYRQPATQKPKDKASMQQLLKAHRLHPLYGTRRLAIHLGWSRNKARRIRSLAGISIKRSKKHRRTNNTANPEIAAPPNILHRYTKFKDDSRPQDGMDYSDMTKVDAWVQDFTYLWFHRQWYYLAAVVDLATRQIVGWRLGDNHSSELTHSALLDALSKHQSPAILHSDQGSEYLSYKHHLLCEKLEVQLSCSDKSSPWQNGFMERVFGTIQDELPLLNQVRDLAELHEVIALTIYYYNTNRIHTALGMSPVAYAEQLEEDKVLQKMVP